MTLKYGRGLATTTPIFNDAYMIRLFKHDIK